MIVDLRSDTVTRPDAAMKAAMLEADLGDDVFGEDPTVKELEEYCATLFGKEEALFCPSGTMSNQIAIKAQTDPLDEIICDKLSHIYNYETGGWAFHSGVSIRLTDGVLGVMTAAQAEACVLPDYDWYPNSKMLCIENTVNKGGGSIYSLQQMKELKEVCMRNNLIYHIDGARLFNALELNLYLEKEIGYLFDSISICISKGLGAPAGSVLIGSVSMIKKARKIRKVMGGGMRQSGILAAACLYALRNNRKRLSTDHHYAKQIGEVLKNNSKIKEVYPVTTNIIIAETEDAWKLSGYLNESGIKCSPFSPIHVRFVTHRDISEDMLSYALDKLKF